MKKIFILTAILFPFFCFSQRTTSAERKAKRDSLIKKMTQEEELGTIIFKKQYIFGIKLTSDGYGLLFEKALQKTVEKADLYSIEIGERRDPKEQRITLSDAYSTSSYIYGKVNNFYYAKLGYARQRLIAGKGNKNGVAISLLYGGGLSLGFLKPYFINVFDGTNNITTRNKNGNDYLFLDANYIDGTPGFTRGFGFISLVPGIYAKTSLRFDFGHHNELISAIEAGINVEDYTQKMRILLIAPAHQMFFNAFVAVEFGKRKK